MTWGSDRSGMASSFTRRIDATAAIRAKPTPSRTSSRLRAQSSMIFSTMTALLSPPSLNRRAQAALRVEQEVAGGHHRLALGDAAQDLDAVLDPRPHLHLARLEPAARL